MKPKTIKLAKKLTVDAAAGYREEILAALESGADEILIDISKVTSIDTAGIQLLISGLKTADQKSKQLHLTGNTTEDVADFISKLGFMDPVKTDAESIEKNLRGSYGI